MGTLKIKTYGPMNTFPLRRVIEEIIVKYGINTGILTLHAKGATALLTIVQKNFINQYISALTKLVPVTGWRHGNAYAHLRSTIGGSALTIPIENNRIALENSYEIYFIETRPVYNHTRTIYYMIRGRSRVWNLI